MTIEVIQLVQGAALLLIALLLAFRKLPAGPPGPPGPPGARGEAGPAGHIRVTGSAEVLRCEMLRDGDPTGHFLVEGSSDFNEALNTPGLSVRFPDGRIEEGVQ